MTIVFLSAGIMAVVMGIMAVGLFSRNRCLRGSCGGDPVLDGTGEPVSCGACPRRDGDQQRSQTTLPPVTSTTEPVT